MTGPEHYQKAENWLFKAEHPDARGGAETSESCAAIAQVHATLALALASAYAYPASEWHKVAGSEVTS